MRNSKPLVTLLLPILVLFGELSSWGKPQMAHSQPKFPSSFPNPTNIESDKGNVRIFADKDNPDLDNSNVLTFTDYLCPVVVTDCLGYLTEKAIANSPILQEIEDKITLVEKQINYLEKKVAYYKSRNWTDYITIEPVKLVQNLFGGGDVQRTQLTITDLEIKSDRLKIELINLEKEKVVKEEEIKLSVVEYLDKLEELQSKIQLLRKQQDNFSIAFNTFLVKYQNGEGSTEQYLNYKDKEDKFEFQLLELNNDYRQTLNKLSLLLGENQ